MARSPAQELLASYRFGYELRSWVFTGEVVCLRVKPSRDGEDKVRVRGVCAIVGVVADGPTGLTVCCAALARRALVGRHLHPQTVSVLTLQFSEIVDLLSYYDRMRKLQKRLVNESVSSATGGHVRRSSLDSFGSN